MGNTTHRPVVAFDAAQEGLRRCRKLGPVTGRFEELRAGPAIPKETFIGLLQAHFGAVGLDLMERLFEVLDSDKSGGLDSKEFVSTMYVFKEGTKDQKLKVMFNMFDLSADGTIKKSEFQQILLAIIVGNTTPEWVLPMNNPTTGEEVLETIGLDYFKPLVETMVEMAMLEFDRNGDGKLNFEEWKSYAQDDPDVQRFLEKMETL